MVVRSVWGDRIWSQELPKLSELFSLIRYWEYVVIRSEIKTPSQREKEWAARDFESKGNYSFFLVSFSCLSNLFLVFEICV